jgi:hypothetical protein
MDYVSDVINYAIKNYEEHGFDLVVETLTREEIASLIEFSNSFDEAVEAVLAYVTPYHQYRKEIQAESF